MFNGGGVIKQIGTLGIAAKGNTIGGLNREIDEVCHWVKKTFINCIFARKNGEKREASFHIQKIGQSLAADIFEIHQYVIEIGSKKVYWSIAGYSIELILSISTRKNENGVHYADGSS